MFVQVRPARSRDLPGLLPVEPPVRVPTAVSYVHVLPRLPHHAARRRHRLRPARARRQVQEDGGDRHAPRHAQELMPRTNEPRTTQHIRFLILANWIGHIFWAHFAFLHLIGHQIISYFSLHRISVFYQ